MKTKSIVNVQNVRRLLNLSNIWQIDRLCCAINSRRVENFIANQWTSQYGYTPSKFFISSFFWLIFFLYLLFVSSSMFCNARTSVNALCTFSMVYLNRFRQPHYRPWRALKIGICHMVFDLDSTYQTIQRISYCSFINSSQFSDIIFFFLFLLLFNRIIHLNIFVDHSVHTQGQKLREIT